MNVKVDFQLNYQYSVIERIIFRLVLNGFTDVHEIRDALPIFSDEVIANGIKNLVNRQLINANVKNGVLTVTDSISALIDASLNGTIEVSIPENLKTEFDDGGILISSSQDKNVNQIINQLKRKILEKMLPEINLDVLTQSLDFVLIEDREDIHVE